MNGRHLCLLAARTLGAAFALVCAAAPGQDVQPAQVGLSARCYYPGQIVLQWPPAAGEAAVLRAPLGGEEREIGRAAGDAGVYYDVEPPAGAAFLYRVRLADGRVLGPAPAANSAEMLVGGDFETDALGSANQTLAFHRAYGPPRWRVERGTRPGGDGRRLLRILAGRAPRPDGLHSRLFPIQPEVTYRQSGWRKKLKGSNAAIGRRLLNARLKPAGGRIVAYSYAPVRMEKPGGWQYCEQRLARLPKDAAFLQVWALAFKSRGDVWFDDLSLIDERVERLARFDSKTALPRLAALAAQVGDAALTKRVDSVRRRIPQLEARLRAPRDMPLKEYLAAVAALDREVRRAQNLAWDLKILLLAR